MKKSALLLLIPVVCCSTPRSLPVMKDPLSRAATSAGMDAVFESSQSMAARWPENQREAFLNSAVLAIESVRLGKPIYLTPDWIPLEGRALAAEANATGPFFPHTEGNITLIRRIPDSTPPPFDDDEETGLPFREESRPYEAEQGIRYVMRWLANRHIYAVNSSRRKTP